MGMEATLTATEACS